MIQIDIPELGVEYKEAPPTGDQLYLCLIVTPVTVGIDQADEWRIYVVSASSEQNAKDQFPPKIQVTLAIPIADLFRFAKKNALDILSMTSEEEVLQ